MSSPPDQSTTPPAPPATSSSHRAVVIAVVVTAVITSLFIGIGFLVLKKLKQKRKSKENKSPTSVSYGNPLLETNSRSDSWKGQVGTETPANGQLPSRQNDSSMQSVGSKHGNWQGSKLAFDPTPIDVLNFSKPNQFATENQHGLTSKQQVQLPESQLELGNLDRLGAASLRSSSLPASLAKEKGLTNLPPLPLAHEPLVAPLHSSHGSEESARFSDLSFDDNMNFGGFESLGMSGTLGEQLSDIFFEQEHDLYPVNYLEMASRQSLAEKQQSFNNARLLAESFGPPAVALGNLSTTTSEHPAQKSNTAVSGAFNFTPQFVPPLPLPPALVSAAILKQKSAPPDLEVQPSVPVKSAVAAYGKKSSEVEVGSPTITTGSILPSLPVKSVAAAFGNQAHLARIPSSYSAADAQPSVPVKVVASTFDNRQSSEEEATGLSFPSSSKELNIPGDTYVSEMKKFYSSQNLLSSASAPPSEMAELKSLLSAAPVAPGNPFVQASVPLDMKLSGKARHNIVSADGSSSPVQTSATLNSEDPSLNEGVTFVNPQAVSATFHGDTFPQGVLKGTVDGVPYLQNSQAQADGVVSPVSAIVQETGQMGKAFPSTGQHIPQVVGVSPPPGGAAVPSMPDPSSTLGDTSLSTVSKAPPPPPPPPPRSTETVTSTQSPRPQPPPPPPLPISKTTNTISMNAPTPPPPPPLPSIKGLSQPASSSVVTDPKIPSPPPPPPVPAVKAPTAPTPPPPPPLPAVKVSSAPTPTPPQPPPLPAVKGSTATTLPRPTSSAGPPPPPVPKSKGTAPPSMPYSKGPPLPPAPPGPPKGPPAPPGPPKGPPPPPGSQPPAPISSKPPQDPQQASAAQNLQKLKPLHWDKVRADPSQSMVWDRIKTGSFELNEDEISALFGAKPSGNNVLGRAAVPVKRKGILDSKKAQNIAIQLRALNISTQDVCDALLEGSGMKAELLEVLVKMTPTQDEQKALLEFSGDRAELSPAERFLKSVLEIPNAFQRLQAMLFRCCFDDDLAGVQEIFRCLEAASVEVRENRLFLKLLEAVLKTGNRLNMGTNRGEAEAFKLDALLRLSDVKAGDGKTTLLQFVAEEIIRTEGLKALRSEKSGVDPAVENQTASEVQIQEMDVKRKGLEVVWQLCTELRSVKSAADVDADALNQAVLKLSNGLLLIQNRLKTSFQEQAQSSDIFATKDTFGSKMEAFCLQAEKDVLKLKEDVTRVLERVKRVTAYFHGTTRETQPLRLFVIVRDFLGMLEKVCQGLAKSLKMTLRG